MASLPQELINSVVDHLDDYSSLTSCALVSTSFVAPAQQAIFKSLCIHTELSYGHPTPLAANDSLAAFPHLATYIRLLKFDLSHLEHEVQALKSIFLAVRNLERLIISGAGMRWNSIAPTLKIAIQDIIALPSFYGLHLVSIEGLPSHFLYHAAALISVLSTYSVSLEESEDSHLSPGLVSDFRLTDLILSDSGWRTEPLYHRFLAIQTTHLERLTIIMDAESRAYDSEFLSAFTPSLRHLSLRIGRIREPIDLPHLPLLRSLEIKRFANARFLDSPGFQPTFSEIAIAFRNLELLTLVFIFTPNLPNSPASPSLFAETLPPFPDRAQFPHLRQVHCQLLPRDTGHDFSPAFVHFCAAMDAQLACFRGTGILRCSLADTSPRFFRRLPFYQIDLVHLNL
ncbi:hypothetical protein C8J57DRAFT_1721337 [Mycena rebaudengoi]|nr:hypothetical protein C8J57DRAFT_1721337 [Mycena rebaudengoi]